MTNAGGLLHKGGTLKISPELLKYEVQDTDHSKTKDAVYTLVPMRDNPRHGEPVFHCFFPAVFNWLHSIGKRSIFGVLGMMC